MAALVVTENSVLPGAGTKKIVTWGETITKGVPVYLKTDGLYWKADANASALTAVVEGISLTGGVVNQAGVIQTSGPFTPGATLVKGMTYYAGPTPGEIIPEADLATNDYVTELFKASTTALATIAINPTGIQHA